MNRVRALVTVVAALVVSLCATFAHGASSSTFNYQGNLTQAGAPSNGAFDMQFSLWNALSGGAQIGSTVTVNGVTVTNGLFAVQLDFGPSAFDNTSRWLQISVNSTTLAPRQAITAVPYAIQTRGIYVDDLGNVGIGTTAPGAQLYIDGTGSPYSGLFVNKPGSANGSVSIGSPNSTTGIVGLSDNGRRNDIRFGSDGMSLYVSEDGSIPSRGIFIYKSGSIGIGTESPIAALHANGDAAGFGNVGVRGEGLGEGVFGLSASTTSGRGVLGWATASSGTAIGVEGIGNSASGYDFYAAGAGINYGAPSSIRWKRNIEAIGHPLDLLAQVRGVYFDWDQAHGNRHDVGFIGEEVGKVLPEVVAYEADGKFVTGMDYSKMTPLLVEAVNALRVEENAENAALRMENDELRTRLAVLESSVAQLMAMQKEQSAGASPAPR